MNSCSSEVVIGHTETHSDDDEIKTHGIIIDLHTCNNLYRIMQFWIYIQITFNL